MIIVTTKTSNFEMPEEVHFHHTATAAGYISRKSDPIVEPYNGKFGRGYKVHRPRYDSTQFHFVDYYVYPDTAKDNGCGWVD